MRIIKCYCPSCEHYTNHEVLHTEVEQGDDDDYWWRRNYSIARCCGCEQLIILTETPEEGDVEYDENGNQYVPTRYKTYPTHEPIAKGLMNLWPTPESISNAYKETLTALNNNCFLLAAAGFRMIIEAVCLENNIQGKPLESKINNLCKKDIITRRDRDRLHSIRFMGNDSVHQIKSPTKEELLLVLDIVNIMLKNLYILENKCSSILDGPIKDFEEFEALLEKGIKNRNIGEVDVLKNIVPKDRRLIHEDLKDFECELQDRIKSGSYSRLSLCPSPQQGKSRQNRE